MADDWLGVDICIYNAKKIRCLMRGSIFLLPIRAILASVAEFVGLSMYTLSSWIKHNCQIEFCTYVYVHK